MSKLSRYFIGIAAKRLTAVETDLRSSNQHEFNGVRQMTDIFGSDKLVLPCRYLYLGDDETQTISADGNLTWYDSRANHPSRTEYRMYFQSNEVTDLAAEGDLLVVGRRQDGTVLILIVKHKSIFERQVIWLFNIPNESRKFTVSTVERENNREIGFAEQTILKALGIDIVHAESVWLDRLIELFGMKFPTTREFSAFARSTLPDVTPIENPDLTLLSWLNREEMLFRTLERQIVQERIDLGFDSVDDFVGFSLTVHNRRKSRVGFALENHLEQLFLDNNILYTRGAVTENNARPDFIFPSIISYRDDTFQADKLTMLGVKSTCKDRWRQVLSEARRVRHKHLLTLELGISKNQTDEMRDNNLQLILPKDLHASYLPEQQAWLMNVSEFLEMVMEHP